MEKTYTYSIVFIYFYSASHSISL